MPVKKSDNRYSTDFLEKNLIQAAIDGADSCLTESAVYSESPEI